MGNIVTKTEKWKKKLRTFYTLYEQSEQTVPRQSGVNPKQTQGLKIGISAA